MSVKKQSRLSDLVVEGVCHSKWSGNCVLCFDSINQRDVIVLAGANGLERRWHHLNCLKKWVEVEVSRRGRVNVSAAKRRKALKNKGK